MSVSTFQVCPVAGPACSVLSLLSLVKDPFYQTIPSCFKTDPKNPKQIQCLPKGFQSILPRETEETNLWTIRNSIFDNCSPTDGADAGCGKNLQCNYYKIGTNINRYTCEPTVAGPNPTGPVPLSALTYYETASWHQTCGPSAFSFYFSIKCDQTTAKGPLVCSPVNAYVNGVIAKKSICITSQESALLQKRVVKALCYSGCPPGEGNSKVI